MNQIRSKIKYLSLFNKFYSTKKNIKTNTTQPKISIFKNIPKDIPTDNNNNKSSLISNLLINKIENNNNNDININNSNSNLDLIKKEEIFQEIDKKNQFINSNEFFDNLSSKLISNLQINQTGDINNNTANTGNGTIKQDKDNFEIYKDLKQYNEYKTLTIVRAKEPRHRDHLLQQLKLFIPKGGWKLVKEHPNLVCGNVTIERYKEFIEKQTYFDKHKNIKIKEIDYNEINNNNNDGQSNSNNQIIQPFIGFSKQILPNSIEVKEKTNQGWTDKACDFIMKNYRHCKWRKWRIHLITPTSSINSNNNERLQLESMIINKIKKLSKPLHNLYSFNATNNRPLPLKNDEALIQIMFVNKDFGYISITTPTIYQFYEKMISIYPSGLSRNLDVSLLPQYIHQLFSPQISQCHIHIQRIKNHLNPSLPLDKESIKNMNTASLISTFLPSRSFVKLFELFERFPTALTGFPTMKPMDSVVDLGSSPGGWTLFSLLQGCRVVSIDKSPLDDTRIDLENDDDNLIFLEMDAFEFHPGPVTFDWLIIDMKVPPMKSLILLEQWLKLNRCRNFIINLKFQSIDHHIVQHERFIQNHILPLSKYLNSHCLDYNGEKELTLFGISK